MVLHPLKVPLILTHVRHHLLAALPYDFDQTIETLSNLAGMSDLYQEIFNPDNVLPSKISSLTYEISFRVFQDILPLPQGAYRSHSMGNPVRCNSRMFVYINEWYRCPDCLQKLAQYFVDNTSLSLETSYSIPSEDWPQLLSTGLTIPPAISWW